MFDWKQNTDLPGGYAMTNPDDSGIILGTGPSPDGGAGWVTFYVWVDSIDATLAKVEQLGGRTVMPKFSPAPGNTIAMVADPERHVIADEQQSGERQIRDTLHCSPMTVRTRALDRGTARGRHLVQALCRELDEARLDRGLSYAALGRAVGLSGPQVGRICQGRSARVSIFRLAQLFALVGLELGAKGFPGGQPIRDGGHVALLRRFRDRIDPGLCWRTEVPVVDRPDGRGDLRAWDATVGGPGWLLGIEAETHVRDVQALERRLALKIRDGTVSGVILVLNDTHHHRELMRAATPGLQAAFPISSRTALQRLRRGVAAGINAIVLI